MDLVIGGVCQGKSKWAAKNYRIDDGFYCITTLDCLEREGPVGNILIIENLEFSVKNAEDLEKGRRQIIELGDWEKAEKDRRVVFIGSQIGSGIVPIEPEAREWRDNLGFFYQDLASRCQNVYRVWAGISEKIKG